MLARLFSAHSMMRARARVSILPRRLHTIPPPSRIASSVTHDSKCQRLVTHKIRIITATTSILYYIAATRAQHYV